MLTTAPVLPRLLEAACASPADAPPKQRAVMEGALNLAIRLGLPAGALLGRLLDPAAGPALYERFPRVVRARCRRQRGGCSPIEQCLLRLSDCMSASFWRLKWACQGEEYNL